MWWKAVECYLGFWAEVEGSTRLARQGGKELALGTTQHGRRGRNQMIEGRRLGWVGPRCDAWGNRTEASAS